MTPDTLQALIDRLRAMAAESRSNANWGQAVPETARASAYDEAAKMMEEAMTHE